MDFAYYASRKDWDVPPFDLTTSASSTPSTYDKKFGQLKKVKQKNIASVVNRPT